MFPPPWASSGFSKPTQPPLHTYTHSAWVRARAQLLPQSFCTGSRLAALTVGALVAAQWGSCRGCRCLLYQRSATFYSVHYSEFDSFSPSQASPLPGAISCDPRGLVCSCPGKMVCLKRSWRSFGEVGIPAQLSPACTSSHGKALCIQGNRWRQGLDEQKYLSCLDCKKKEKRKIPCHSLTQLKLLLTLGWLVCPSWSTSISHFGWDGLKNQQKLHNTEICTQQFEIRIRGKAEIDSNSIYYYVTSRTENSDHWHIWESLFRPGLISTVGVKLHWKHMSNTPKEKSKTLQFQWCMPCFSHESWQKLV